MPLLDAFWHLVHLFLPAWGTAALAAAAAKLLWRPALRGVRWWTLAATAAAAGMAVTVAGLLWTGHDGRMLTYGGVVLATALTLWLRLWRR